MSVSRTASKSTASNNATPVQHTSLMTPPPTPKPHTAISKAEIHAQKKRAKKREKYRKQARRDVLSDTAKPGIQASAHKKRQKSSDGKCEERKRGSQFGSSATRLNLQNLARPHNDGGDDDSQPRTPKRKIKTAHSHQPHSNGTNDLTPSKNNPHISNDTEAPHDLELDRLMTLHLQRTQAFAASTNTLEKLLAADDPFVTLNNHLLSPTMRAIYEFLLGMQHEQCELWTKTEDLEAQIAEIRQVLGATDYSKLERLEKMLGLTFALSFELILEDGAFRDSYERKRGSEGFDLGTEFGEMRKRVGKVIGEYDGEVERLGREVGEE